MSGLSKHDQLIQQLSTISFFEKLDQKTLHDLAHSALWREYQAGEVVFWEGDQTPGLYYIQSGWLKVVKSTFAGREQVLLFLQAGDIFNEYAAFTNKPSPATVMVLESAEIWLLRRERLMHLLREEPDFAPHLIEKMAERLFHLVTLVADLSLRPVSGRLARLLLDQATNNVLHRPRWYTQTELAARLGTVPDVIQRVLRQLQANGIIAVQRHQIRILDQEALEEIAA